MRWRPFAATALVLLAAAAPARAAEPILPLGEVRPGMQCTGLTVVRGVDIASFDVEIVDVVAGDPISDQPLLLVRVSGPIAAPTGIAEGFSGSPVVCDGRVAGAIAYGTGDYGNELGFATPIEAVLGQLVYPPPDARRRPRLVRRARPLTPPLAVTGVSRPVFAPFARAAERAGLPLVQAPAAPSDARFPVQELRPGSSMAVGLSSGDVGISAIGTVSYVDGEKVWGFGHPLEAAGRRSLLLQDAYVYAVVDNPLGVEGAVSYKLAAPGHDLGTLTSDGRNAVAGVLGALPPRTRLRIAARRGDRGPTRVTRADIADETAVGLPDGVSAASFVAPMALAQTAYVTLDGSPSRQTAEMCVRIAIRELRKPAGFCNRYVGNYGSTGGQAVGGPFVFDLYDALLAIDDFRYGTPHVTGIDVALRIAPRLDQALLRAVRGPRVLRPGATAVLRLDLQRYRGERFTRRVRLHVPRRARPGQRRLVIDGTPADSDFGEVVFEVPGDEPMGGADGPTTFEQLARRIASIRRFDGVTFRLAKPRARRGRPRPLLRDPDVRISGRASYRVRVAPARGRAARGDDDARATR
ncbi:MAG TPA: hypothetical protein VFR97_11585 [Capillimicrobium sp.]|nr:hypothetical protein [Capillimicrobium sp.]